MNKLVATILSLASLGGLLFGIDARYMHADAAEQAVQELRADIERVRLSNELATQRAKLSFLANKQDATTDDRLEMDFIRGQIALLQAQLSALQK